MHNSQFKDRIFGRAGLHCLLIASFASILSCNRLHPAGFWVEYEKEHLKENKWDFGPFGGFVAMHWRASYDSAFSENHILNFAESHGWEQVDKTSFKSDTVRSWTSSGKPIFFGTYSEHTYQANLSFDFPRWIDSDLVVYRFKTGWIAVQPGNKMETRVNGYLVVSADRCQFSVYHLWGE
ncbi:hypothetical protein [Dyadobacter sp. MSC1_007]|jgi:hypothetical protein|uniref:hypothetical protein n=1 Tax=Dyadobacter sp. MSC1_007 TaxID=2909264 RepID=UPI0020307DC6|nr:hypothetical protein [Dyadobacter sp. MSC1_007]